MFPEIWSCALFKELSEAEHEQINNNFLEKLLVINHFFKDLGIRLLKLQTQWQKCYIYISIVWRAHRIFVVSQPPCVTMTKNKKDLISIN